MNATIHKFKTIDITYPYELNGDPFCWSRIYEYPLVISLIEQYKNSSSNVIHNTSWGFAGCHVWFKEKLESRYGAQNITNSDFLKSKIPNTCVWDITTPPPLDWKNKFDFVVNVSTMEEVDFNHIEVFKNLLSMVKPNGYLICTFDIPGLQLSKFEELFQKQFNKSDNYITGSNSAQPNNVCSNLTCGYLVLQKH